MLYCPDCQSLCEEEKRCPFCGGKRLRLPEESDPVFLLTTDEVKAGMMEAALQTSGIPFEERVAGLGGPPRILVGASVYTNKKIFVPYGKVEASRTVLEGLGITGEEEHPSGEQGDPQPGGEDGEELNPRKKMMARISLFFLFITVIWAVVSVADRLANALKDFLYHL